MFMIGQRRLMCRVKDAASQKLGWKEEEPVQERLSTNDDIIVRRLGKKLDSSRAFFPSRINTKHRVQTTVSLRNIRAVSRRVINHGS
jgi:hypothetical protein